MTWEEKRNTERERGYKRVHPVRGTGVWAMRAITGSHCTGMDEADSWCGGMSSARKYPISASNQAMNR